MSRPAPASTPPTRERTRRHSWVRVLLPVALILVWLAGASFGGPLFGKVDEVSSNEQTTYLPESADATKVQQLLGEFNDSEAIPAIAVFTSDDELTQSELDAIADAVADAPSVEGVADDVSPALPSDDGLAVQAFIPIDADAELADTTTALGEELRAAVPDGITVFITGPAGFCADLFE
jgi:RND superfamily putative drug exporter